MKKTAKSIEEQKILSESDSIPKKKRGGGAARNVNSLANLVAPWKPGESGNPGGKPRTDVAALIARRVLEGNMAEVYKGLAAGLIGGNAYTFQVLADRGYGKLKEKMELSGDDELLSRLLNGRKRVAERSKAG